MDNNLNEMDFSKMGNYELLNKICKNIKNVSENDNFASTEYIKTATMFSKYLLKINSLEALIDSKVNIVNTFRELTIKNYPINLDLFFTLANLWKDRYVYLRDHVNEESPRNIMLSISTKVNILIRSPKTSIESYIKLLKDYKAKYESNMYKVGPTVSNLEFISMIDREIKENERLLKAQGKSIS